jgi:hypothetical protein
VTPFDPYAYLDAVSAALDLPIPPERRDAVAANLRRLHAMADEVMAFHLPADLPAGSAPP